MSLYSGRDPAKEGRNHMLSSSAAIVLNVHRVDIAIWTGARQRALCRIMGCETASHLHEGAAAADASYTACHNLFQSPARSNTHTRTHTLIIVTVILLCKCTRTQAQLTQSWSHVHKRSPKDHTTRIANRNLQPAPRSKPSNLCSYLTCTHLIVRMMNCGASRRHSCDIFTRGCL